MSTLVLILPDEKQVLVSVADDTLVYDGQNYVHPSVAKYVALYTVPVDALSLPFEVASQEFMTRSLITAQVVAYNPVSKPSTNPLVIAEPDPSLGECVCFVTCKGTWLSYVRVVQE